ncbi:NAD-dependent epimerase [Gammaproteobacteria bacterium]|nr:NAD-dependent epimerase [Gammaproteobacteria bacterium]
MLNKKSQTLLLTGAAGFIGMHTCEKFLESGISVIGIDNINDYYDIQLKKDRIKRLKKNDNFSFYEVDITDKKKIEEIFKTENPTFVIHLAAQAGVRYSITNPHAYVDANIHGFLNVLEGCRSAMVEHLIYASSSSVYGGNTNYPFQESQNIDHPISLYAATKKSNELMAHTYSHLYNIPTTGLRFFTVYGPWGRPDMALFLFADAMRNNRPIDVYNHGNMTRDFTYVDDIVESLVRLTHKPTQPNKNFDSHSPDPSSSMAPYSIYNIGNGCPTPLIDYITALEDAMGIEVEKNFLPIQPGDVPMTSADSSKLYEFIGFKPNTPVKLGVSKFADWYKQYYKF